MEFGRTIQNFGHYRKFLNLTARELRRNGVSKSSKNFKSTVFAPPPSMVNLALPVGNSVKQQFSVESKFSVILQTHKLTACCIIFRKTYWSFKIHQYIINFTLEINASATPIRTIRNFKRMSAWLVVHCIKLLCVALANWSTRFDTQSRCLDDIIRDRGILWMRQSSKKKRKDCRSHEQLCWIALPCMLLYNLIKKLDRPLLHSMQTLYGEVPG